MTVEKCYKPLRGFCTCLDEELEKDDCGIGVPAKYRAKLCQELGDKYYTHLVIYDGFCSEIVQVEQSHGNLYIVRGLEDTESRHWPCGTSVKFDWTETGLHQLIKKPNESDEGEKCPEETFTGEIKNGNCTVTFKNGVAIKSKPNKKQIRDGCYRNPVIEYEDGCVVGVQNVSDRTRYQTTCEKDCGINCTCR